MELLKPKIQTCHKMNQMQQTKTADWLGMINYSGRKVGWFQNYIFCEFKTLLHMVEAVTGKGANDILWIEEWLQKWMCYVLLLLLSSFSETTQHCNTVTNWSHFCHHPCKCRQKPSKSSCFELSSRSKVTWERELPICSQPCGFQIEKQWVIFVVEVGVGL